MKYKNIWKDIEPPLELNKDTRGEIVDIFYNENINHVATIKSKPKSIRGNHYHKLTTQHILITKGSLVYWFKDFNSSEPSKSIEVLREIL